MTDRATLASFVAELRTIGLPVSVSENVDAMAAILAMPITDRAALKSALAATLVKNSEHYNAFDLVFEIFFGDRRIGSDSLSAPTGSGVGADGNGAAANGAGGGGGGAGVVAMFSDADLGDLLFRAVLAGDRVL